MRLAVINLNFVSFRLCTGLAWDKDGDTLGIIHDNKSGRSINYTYYNIYHIISHSIY